MKTYMMLNDIEQVAMYGEVQDASCTSSYNVPYSMSLCLMTQNKEPCMKRYRMLNGTKQESNEDVQRGTFSEKVLDVFL